MTRTAVSLATLTLALLGSFDARAQTPLIGAGFGLASGLERSELLESAPFRRARTRFVVPVDLRFDEERSEGFGVVGFAEIEPHTSLGGEFRYVHWLSKSVSGFAGVTGVLAPHTLAGFDVGVDLHIPFSPTTALFVEPSFAALPLGTDLPDDHVLLWVLLAVGFHADL